MKIALINPSVPGALKKENLGLAYLAATIQEAGHTTRIIDEIVGQDVDEGLDDFRPDVVGISFMTMYALRAYELADRIRKQRGLTVVLGGAHATALPQEAIQHGDCVIRGEAEWTFPKLLENGKIEGIIEAEAPEDLDALPIPSREQLDLDTYASGGDEIAGFSYRTLGTITSRGCPFSCSFCINSKRESKLRFHSPERVIEEIKYLTRKHHIQSVAFYDELMATDVKRFRAICEAMLEEGLDTLRWECQMHAKTVRRDTLDLMKKAGCVQVAIGFESGSQTVLDVINKGATVEINLEAARMVREAGLRTRGCFVIGAPGETREDIGKTERFIKDARIDFASIHYLTPMPGTALFDQLRERIEEANTPWDKFTCGDPSTVNCNDALSTEEQKRLFEGLAARQAFRNYSLKEMVKRALRNPRHALHVAAKLFTT